MGGLATAIWRATVAWLVVVSAAFASFRLMPGDPADILAAARTLPPDVAAAFRDGWGLERPVCEQFGTWLAGFLTGDWGRSFATGEPVAADLLGRLPWSFAIGTAGLALAVGTGFALGYRAAFQPHGVADRASRLLAVGGQALPAFAVGLALLWLFAVELRLVRPLTGPPAERLVLPVLLVALFSVGGVARVARAAFAEVAAAPFMRTALAKGLSPAAALWRHGRRHAGLTIVAAMTPELAWVLGGTAVAEIVFGIPGLSDRVVASVTVRDYPVLQAFVAIVALWIVATAEAARLVRRRLDPRLAG